MGIGEMKKMVRRMEIYVKLQQHNTHILNGAKRLTRPTPPHAFWCFVRATLDRVAWVSYFSLQQDGRRAGIFGPLCTISS